MPNRFGGLSLKQCRVAAEAPFFRIVSELREKYSIVFGFDAWRAQDHKRPLQQQPWLLLADKLSKSDQLRERGLAIVAVRQGYRAVYKHENHPRFDWFDLARDLNLKQTDFVSFYIALSSLTTPPKSVDFSAAMALLEVSWKTLPNGAIEIGQIKQLVKNGCWFGDSGNDTAGLHVSGLEGTEGLAPMDGLIEAHLSLWSHPDHGVLIIYEQWHDGQMDTYTSKGDMSRLKDLTRSLHDTPLPVGLFIPPAKAWPAVKEFMETDGIYLPTSIEWVNNDDLPKNTFPDP